MNESAAVTLAAATRLHTIAGKTVGLLDISKPGGNIFLDRLEDLLRTRYAVAQVLRFRKPTFAKPAPSPVIEQIRGAGCEAVIEALAD